MKKKSIALFLMGSLLTSHLLVAAENQTQSISSAESRASIIVSKSDFKQYFSGGEVRIDPLYPQSNTKTHSAAYVTFEPGARSNWHTHPAGPVSYTHLTLPTKRIV